VGYGDAVAAGPLTRAHALELDRADPLAGFRDRFEFGDGDRIYVDGNSLGRLAVEARQALEATVDDWGARLVTGWHDWVDLAQRVGDRLGEAALGAAPGQVLVCDSTTVNLYKLAGAVLAVRPGAIVVPSDDFPTDRYVLEGLAAAGGRELRLLDCDPVHGPQPDAVAAAADGAALVVLSHVNYRSGALADMPAVTRAVQAAGALVLWDLCHSAGAVEVELDDAGADLAVGCTYKYLNAGPGSPAFLYVARRHQDSLRSPIQGWFSQADQFAMGQGYTPVAGIGRFLAGTPPVLGLALVESGSLILRQAGIGAVRQKAAALTSLAVDLHDERLERLGFTLGTPRDPAARGAHISLRHPDAWRVCRALIEHAHVVPDFRRPDSIRLGLPPLYTRFADVWDAFDRLAALVSEGVHERMAAEASRVT
jgi:kynureninase